MFTKFLDKKQYLLFLFQRIQMDLEEAVMTGEQGVVLAEKTLQKRKEDLMDNRLKLQSIREECKKYEC